MLKSHNNINFNEPFSYLVISLVLIFFLAHQHNLAVKMPLSRLSTTSAGLLSSPASTPKQSTLHISNNTEDSSIIDTTSSSLFSNTTITDSVETTSIASRGGNLVSSKAKANGHPTKISAKRQYRLIDIHDPDLRHRISQNDINQRISDGDSPNHQLLSKRLKLNTEAAMTASKINLKTKLIQDICKHCLVEYKQSSTPISSASMYITFVEWVVGNCADDENGSTFWVKLPIWCLKFVSEETNLGVPDCYFVPTLTNPNNGCQVKVPKPFQIKKKQTLLHDSFHHKFTDGRSDNTDYSLRASDGCNGICEVNKESKTATVESTTHWIFNNFDVNCNSINFEADFTVTLFSTINDFVIMSNGPSCTTSQVDNKLGTGMCNDNHRFVQHAGTGNLGSDLKHKNKSNNSYGLGGLHVNATTTTTNNNKNDKNCNLSKQLTQGMNKMKSIVNLRNAVRSFIRQKVCVINAKDKIKGKRHVKGKDKCGVQLNADVSNFIKSRIIDYVQWLFLWHNAQSVASVGNCESFIVVCSLNEALWEKKVASNAHDDDINSIDDETGCDTTEVPTNVGFDKCKAHCNQISFVYNQPSTNEIDLALQCLIQKLQKLATSSNRRPKFGILIIGTIISLYAIKWEEGNCSLGSQTEKGPCYIAPTISAEISELKPILSFNILRDYNSHYLAKSNQKQNRQHGFNHSPGSKRKESNISSISKPNLMKSCDKGIAKNNNRDINLQLMLKLLMFIELAEWSSQLF